MNGVSFKPSLTTNVSFGEKPSEVNTNLLKSEAPVDSFSKTDSKEAKQEIMKKAKTNAAGWAFFGGIFSTMYYGLRSNKTIAKKYDLDPEADKDFIRKIKTEQVKSTLWGAALGLVAAGQQRNGGMIRGGITGLLAGLGWVYNKNRDASKYDV